MIHSPGAAVAGRTAPMARARHDAGFTLIELLLAVALIGIVAAIAVPGMSRARAAALESAAVGLLRSVNSGQATYAASCAQGFYAPSLLWLTRPGGGGDGFISPWINRNTLDRGATASGFSGACAAAHKPLATVFHPGAPSRPIS